MNSPIRRQILAVLALAALTACGRAIAQPANQGPETWRLSVHAAAVPRPALKYALLTDLSDRTPGNAAPMYMMAIGQVDDARSTNVPADHPARKDLGPDQQPDLVQYYGNDITLEQLAAAGREVDSVLRQHMTTFQAFDAATRREDCRWDLPIRDFGIETLLPHLNGSRSLAQAASLRARLHVARREFPEAVAALRGVYQLGYDVAKDGVLVQALVGTGIAAIGNERVKEFVQQPGAPNLYWALAGLPRPFVDLREALEWERTSLLASFPQLRKAESDSFTAADWRDMFSRLNRYTKVASNERAQDASAAASLGPAAAGALMYPAAKRYLIDSGMTAEQVAAMSVPQVLGRYLAAEYRTASEDMLKWAALPFWQGVDGMLRAESEFRRVSETSPAKWILTAVPAVTRARFQLVKLDRQIAALQTVEALRAHAATHDGKLPATLDELKDTPAPADPTTGKPFGYKLEGNRATLESPPPPGEQLRSGLRVEVTIVK